jgi:hypothetical protein
VGEKPAMWEAWVGKDREVIREKAEGISEEGDEEKGSTWDGILVRCFPVFIFASLTSIPQPISASYLNPPTNFSNQDPSNSNSSSRGYTSPHSRSILPWRRYATNSTPGGTPQPSSSAVNVALGPPAPASSSTQNQDQDQSPIQPPTTLTPPLPTGPSIQTPTHSDTPSSSSSSSSSASPTLRLTVLIAMPTAPSARAHAHDHDEAEDGPPVVEFGVVDVGVRHGNGGADAGGSAVDVGTSAGAGAGGAGSS